MKDFDCIIIGAGVAGITAAKKCAIAGLKVALVEQNLVGGKSLNGGGVFIHHIFQSLKALAYSKQINTYSIKGDSSSFNIDYSDLIQSFKDKKENIIDDFMKDINLDQIHFIHGKAKLIDKHSVSINDETYTTNYIILANGGKLNIPTYPGLDKAIKSGFAVEPTEIANNVNKPSEIVIIGGGRISYELASFHVNIGTKVTVITTTVITNAFDSDIKDVLLGLIRNPLITIVIEPESVSFDDHKVHYTFEGQSVTLEPDKVILATGYGVNKALLGNLDIAYNDLGIITDNTLKTSIDTIYAIGDANDKSKLTTVAIEEANVAANNIIGTVSTMKYSRLINSLKGIYEYAYIGLSENEVIQTKEPYYVAKFSLNRDKRVFTRLDTPIIKIILSKVRDEILGIHIVGNDAGEEIAHLYHLLQPKEDKGVIMIPTYSKLNEIYDRINLIKKDYHTNLINQMYSVYQKLYSNHTNELIGFESLSRFVIDGKTTGPLPIIEMLERSGYIRQLDLKSVENAITTLKKLNQEDLTISINIASNTLLNASSQTFRKLMHEAGISPNRITFEITERQIIDHKKVLEALHDLKLEGFKISLDDFSVGHASLLLLDKFPFDEIKLDRELLPTDETDLNRISTYKYLVDLIKQYDVKIVSEGIETEFHYNFIKSLKVDYLQGYYLAKPEVI